MDICLVKYLVFILSLYYDDIGFFETEINDFCSIQFHIVCQNMFFGEPLIINIFMNGSPGPDTIVHSSAAHRTIRIHSALNDILQVLIFNKFFPVVQLHEAVR